MVFSSTSATDNRYLCTVTFVPLPLYRYLCTVTFVPEFNRTTHFIFCKNIE
jgi:hypothetical protein